MTKNCNHPTTTYGNCPKCDKYEVTQLSHVVDERGCDKNIMGDDNDNLVQQTQQQQKQFEKQEIQQNQPNMQTVEPENNGHTILTIEKCFKGENAKHEIAYRIRLPKRLILK